MKKDYNESLKWVNKIIDARFDELRDDLVIYTRFLNLILHFELDNIIVLRYAVESCRRFLKKKKSIEPFEQVLLKFFGKISNSPKSAYKDLLSHLKMDLLEANPPIIDNNVLDYLDFKAWLEERT